MQFSIVALAFVSGLAFANAGWLRAGGVSATLGFIGVLCLVVSLILAVVMDRDSVF